MRLASGGDGKEDSNPTLALHSTVPGPELTARPVRNWNSSQFPISYTYRPHI